MEPIVVITGEGILSSIGNGKAEVLRSLVARKSGIGEVRHLQTAHHELPVGEVPYSDDEMKHLLGIDTGKAISRTTLMGMMAVGEALDDAKIEKDRKLPEEHVLLISGSTVGGMDITEQVFGTLSSSDSYLDHTRTHDCGSNTQMITSHFAVFDDSTTISTACSSSANAIMLGARLIKAGLADLVVAGGCEALTRFHLNGFNALMILDTNACRPFDRDHAGLNLGEGAAYVVLESETHALKRGARIDAYLIGYGNACDAYHQTATSPNGEGAFRAMSEALEMAHLLPSDIDYINAHGTGTVNNDATESAAIIRTFGTAYPYISSTKSYTGHTTSASGSIETVICLIAMQNSFIPANLNWAHPIGECIVPCMGKSDVDLQHVMCNSFGFGGNDTSLILSKEPTAPSETVKRNPVKTLAEVTIDSMEALEAIKKYISPLEARRMSPIVKSALFSSLVSLQQAGVEHPDAIISATTLGCIENSEKLLRQMLSEGEASIKPTWFMQSTHNTIGSSVAIHTHCHGYNITYTHGAKSLEWALLDARLLIQNGKAKTVLVGLHEETTELVASIRERLGLHKHPAIYSKVIVLSC